MIYSNTPFYFPCNRDEIFMTGFLTGCTFLALTFHLVRELALFFKQKEVQFRKDYVLTDESSESESSEQLVEEDHVDVPDENCENSSQNKISSEKSDEVLSQENCLNPHNPEACTLQNIHSQKPKSLEFYCEEMPKTPLRTSQINSDTTCYGYSKYAYRSSGRYMTNSEMEEVAENYKKEKEIKTTA